MSLLGQNCSILLFLIRSTTSTPRKENFYSNRNFEFDVWKKEAKPSKQETNGLR